MTLLREVEVVVAKGKREADAAGLPENRHL
jgi:hypothetical protein